MPEQQRKSFITQGSILAISSLVVRIIGMFYRIPMTRIIGEEGMGYYSVAFELYNLALVLSSFSIPLAVSKLVSARDSRYAYRSSRRVFHVALLVAFCVGLTAALLVYFFADQLAAAVQLPAAAMPLRVLAPTIFVVALMGVLRGFFQGKNTMLPTAYSQVFEQVVNAVVSIVAPLYLMKRFQESELVAAYGASGGTMGTLLGAMTGFYFLVFVFFLNKSYLRRQLGRDRSGYTERYGTILRAFFLTLLPIILSQTVYQLSGTVDAGLFGNIMKRLGVSDTERAVLVESYFNKYRQLTNIPVAVASAMSTATVPALAAVFSCGRLVQSREKVTDAIQFNMLIAIPAAAGLGVLGGPIVAMLYGDTSAVSATLMQMGSISVVFFAYSTITNGILQGINCARLSVVHSAISLALHAGLLYVLLAVLKLGVYALVIGNVLFALVICLLNARAIAKRLSYRQEIKRTFVLPTLASIAMALVAYAVYHGMFWLLPYRIPAVLLAFLCAVAVYFVLVLRLGAMGEKELRNLPKGASLVRLCRRLRLLRDE